MTILTRRITRLTHATLGGTFGSDRGRRLVVSIEPGDIVVVRPHGTRRPESVHVTDLYSFALRARVNRAENEKRAAKREAKAARLKTAALARGQEGTLRPLMSTTTIDLRNLSPEDHYNALRVAVARLAGLNSIHHPTWGDPWSYSDPYDATIERPLPPYPTSADAVMPLLEKAAGGRYAVAFTARHHSCWPSGYVVHIKNALNEGHEGTADTFATAACVALLRANGIEVLD